MLAWEIRRVRRRRTLRKDLLQYVIEEQGHEIARGMLHQVEFDGLSPKNWLRLIFLFFVWGVAAHGTATRARTLEAQLYHTVGFLVPSGMLLLNWLRAELLYKQILLPDPKGWLRKVQIPHREWELLQNWKFTLAEIAATPSAVGDRPGQDG